MNGKPRVIRKVTGRDRRGEPKVAKDRRTGITMERVKASSQRGCANPNCPYFPIQKGEEYAKVTDFHHERGVHVRGQSILTQDFHWKCVPEREQPLVRFFRPSKV